MRNVDSRVKEENTIYNLQSNMQIWKLYITKMYSSIKIIVDKFGRVALTCAVFYELTILLT